MTKKKRGILIIALALVLAAAIFCLWYTRPLSFDQLSPDVDLPPCEEIQISANYASDGFPSHRYDLILTPEDPAFDQLLSLFEGQTYRRSLWNLLPQGAVQRHTLQPGDFLWAIHLGGYADTQFPDGTIAGGYLLDINNFYGTVEVTFFGKTWRVNIPDMDQWLADVMDIIMQFPAEE